MAVKNTVVEITFLLLLLSMFAILCSSIEPSNCNFNISYEGRRVVYNFTRLSRQQAWHATNGEHVVSISVCHPFPTPSLCQNSSLCVSRQEDKTWNVVISNSGTYHQSSHHIKYIRPKPDGSVLELMGPDGTVADIRPKPSGPVLELMGMQSCSGEKNYGVEIYFTCSSTEQEPVLVALKDSCKLLMTWQTSAACSVDEDCVFRDNDFSSLRHLNHYKVETVAGQKFFLNLCGPVLRGTCSDNDLVTACEIDKNNKTTIIGQMNRHHLELSDSTGLALIYSVPGKGPRTEIRLICNASASNSEPKFMDHSGKIYRFEVETPLACNVWPQECMVLDYKNRRIDLSPLRKDKNNWMTRPSFLGVQYHINVCGPLNPVQGNRCADGAVGACRTDSNSSISLGIIGSGPRIIKSNTVILQYTGGSPCPSGGRHSMQIEFSCSSADQVPVFMKKTYNCVHHFSWETTAACPNMVAVGHNCVVTEQQYGHIFKLMDLRSTERDYSLTTEQGDNYLINVCGPLSRPCHGQQASVCLTTKTNREFALGRVNKTVIYDNGGLRFVLQGEGCSPEKKSSTVTIILLCRQGGDLGHPEMFPQDNECNFYFVWYTRAACPPHKSVDCTITRNGEFYDLSPLTDLMSNHVVMQTQPKLKFLFNVCHSIVFGKDASCPYTSAACLVNMSNPDSTTSFTNIGDLGSGPYIEDGRLKLKYNGGEICRDPEGPDHTSTIITFECDHLTSYMPIILPGDVCVYNFLWRTPFSCPIKKKSEKLREVISCTVMVPGTNNRIDLSPLQNKVQTVSDSDGHNYTFVVCGNLSSSLCGNSGVGICQFKVEDQSQFWNAGVGSSRLHYDLGAISLEYTHGAPCNNDLKRSTKIEFVCAANSSEQIVFVDESDNCTYLISWHTPLACSRLVQCVTPTRDGNDPVDLSPLIRSDRNYKVETQNGTVFYINVCRPLLPVRGLSCAGGSSACIARQHDGNLSDEKSLGFASGPVKGDEGKASIMYLKGSECNSGPSYSSKFDFECDPRSGKGQPEFKRLTDDCQYQFLWKTSVTCDPFRKKVSVSEEQCLVNNDQMNVSIDLKTLGERGVVQVKGDIHKYTVNLCTSGTGVKTSDKSYGMLTGVEFDYRQELVRLLFTRGANCTSTETYGSQVLLICDRDAGSSLPKVLKENDCGVVIEWQSALVCDVLVPETAHFEDNAHGSSVGLVVGLIVLVAILCSLVLYFRKPANRSQVRSRVTSLLGIRHNGQFHYSRLEAADEASQLLVSHLDGQESDSDDELLRM